MTAHHSGNARFSLLPAILLTGVLPGAACASGEIHVQNFTTPWAGWLAVGLFATAYAVVIAEEAYFRGALYSFFERQFSVKSALIVSSILFGFFHTQQGLRGVISRTFTGWLWGSVCYSTGMIFLLIFPVHFAYNSIWLLFEGNWNNPPVWAIYAMPAIEFVLGLAIVILRDGKPKNILTISGSK